MILTVACIIGVETVPGDSFTLEAQSPPPTATVKWRRTVNGWERADLWDVGNLSSHDAQDDSSPSSSSTTATSRPTAPLPPPIIHPIAVAFFLLFTAALMAAGTRSDKT